jgi:hypothetical protein
MDMEDCDADLSECGFTAVVTPRGLLNGLTPIQPKRLPIVSHLSAELHPSLCAGVEPAHFSTIIRKLEIREHAAKA